MKRFFSGILKLTGLLTLLLVFAAIAPKAGLFSSLAVLLAAAIAVIKPLPSLGLGHRGFSMLVLAVVGPLGVIASAGLMLETGNQADIETMIEPAYDETERETASVESFSGIDRHAVAEKAHTGPMEGGEGAEPTARAETAPPEPTEDATAATGALESAGPIHVKAQSWETHCEPGCRTYTTADFRAVSDAPPTKIVFEVSPAGSILISALDTEAQHEKFYTNSVPVELRLDGVNYVPAMYFFAKRSTAQLIIDGGTTVRLSPRDQSHYGADATEEAIAALRTGSRAELVFGGQRIVVSLLGFTKAYDARTGSPEAPAPPAPEPRSVVAAKLIGDKFKLEPERLLMRENPRGEGSFVFFPEMEIEGYQRLFVWFVHGDQAVALNGPSKTATPHLPFPRDVGFEFWAGTGLSVGDATLVGLEVAFE